ncbi:TetR/AcrR family transcriptional regulator C-terminal domain-containing protein [Streptococcus suis]|uniref:TetR/AcrR family transcriptional regulator n=1 Tax=Streptococcus suis TaxID=1307 RepID=UPI003707086A
MENKAPLRLQQALIKLLDQQELDQISVSKICKEASVHRSTFYSYYNHQYELLEDALQGISRLFDEEYELEQTKLQQTSDIDSILDTYYLKPYLLFIKKHRKLYRIYLERSREFNKEETFSYHMEKTFSKRLKFKGIKDSRQIELTARFYVAGLRAIINDWVLSDCLDDVDDIIRIIHEIVF